MVSQAFLTPFLKVEVLGIRSQHFILNKGREYEIQMSKV